jgi:hypothetical protein
MAPGEQRGSAYGGPDISADSQRAKRVVSHLASSASPWQPPSRGSFEVGPLHGEMLAQLLQSAALT